MSPVIDTFTAYLPAINRSSVNNSWTLNTSGSHKLLSLHPSISAWTTHGLPLITSPSKMTTVLIRRNAPTDSCRNLTALMPRCTKTSFLITPHYICAHRNSDNLHNAAFKGYFLVREWPMSTLLWSYIRFSIPFYLIFLDIKCGGGFYVRSLVHDLGEGVVSEIIIIYRTCPLKI